MNEDVHVASRKTERLRHVLARAFFQESQGDDRALDAAQLGEACAKADGVLGVEQELFGVGKLGRESRLRCVGSFVEGRVRFDTEVAAPKIASGVPHHGEDRRGGGPVGVPTAVAIGGGDLERKFAVPLQTKKRAECILHALQRFFRARSFASCGGDQFDATGADDEREPLQRVDQPPTGARA